MTPTTTPPCTIVIAWTEMDGMEPTGKMERFDGYNYRPVFRPAEKARAAVWINRGGPADIAKAKAHLATIEGKVRNAVYALPTKERDPLGVARKRILS